MGFDIPKIVRSRVHRATRSGTRLIVTPSELLRLLDQADKALNGDSNDAERDALHSIREILSDILEDPDRRLAP